MKNIFKKSLLFAVIAIAISSCTKDDVDNENAELGYGSDLTIVLPADFSDKFPLESIICEIRTSTPELCFVTATHATLDGNSVLILDQPLPVGKNILRAVRYTGKTSSRSNDYTEIALGCTINVTSSSNSIFPFKYDDLYSLFGDGSAESPYQIASALNFAAINEMDDTDYFFTQSDSIDFLRYYAHETGFEGICPEINKPFKGHFTGGGADLPIKNLAVRKFTSEEEGAAFDVNVIKPAGLFCCVSGAYIENIVVDDPDISGSEAVGGVVGVILGDSADQTASATVDNCHVIRNNLSSLNRIYGIKALGGIVGGVEYAGSMVVSGCSVAKGIDLVIQNAESGGGYLGGIVGGSGLNATITISDCINNAEISGAIQSLGGIIGTAQTLRITCCTNNGNVKQSYSSMGSYYSEESAIAVGGLVGGSTDAIILGSTNNGTVVGYRGVGGIIGSTIYDTGADPALYGNAAVVSSHNYAAITGYSYTGGIVGEGQVSLTNCYNEADISGTDCYVGGLVGFSSAIVARGSHNSGDVYSRNDAVGGISGAAEFFFIYGCSNFGTIGTSLSSYNTGGIIGRSSEYGLTNYVINFGDIYNGNSSACESYSSNCGGIFGSMGDHLSTADKGAVYVQDVAADFAMLFVKTGLLGGSLTSTGKPHKIMATLLKGIEVLEIVKESLEGSHIANERDEREEEFEELSSEIYSSAEASLTDMDSAMSTKLNSLISSKRYDYDGAMSELQSNIASIAFNNMMAFAEAVDTDTTDYSQLEDGATESEVYTTMMVSSFNDLVELCEKNAEAAFWNELASIIESAVVAVASLALGVGFHHATKLVKETVEVAMTLGSCVGSLVIDAQSTYTSDAENVIIMNQAMNFGKVGGNGLIGTIGDRVSIRNSLSAGVAAGYSIANSADTKNVYDSGILCIGKSNQKPYSDKGISSGDIYNVITYGDGTDGTYTAEQLKDKSIFEKDNNNDDDDQLNWSWDLWNMDQTGGELPLPYNSRFLSFL